ncbi:hypothetical protein [Chryseobacterium sp. ERMR1:04]|uniref:hypothetical protein n=1 Tax=Chryseobacterium sp. ERMR1:04 TaxID=1705393 RepID=UPI0006C87C4D|nr:hypothetical protein [Chryseobacterium sp. ERMR1:04]KPH12976.1 hypothetical protein AMQ68_10735 [Chryseobacterium sp. ERMR1:04]
MEIKYLDILIKYPEHDKWKNKGISEDEILLLEYIYNKENPFPKVLKELLTLAGNFCYALDYSVYDSQIEMQQGEHEELLNIHNFIIPRPVFFVCLISHGLPLFLFLDEGHNPPLNQIINNPTLESYYRRTGGTLQGLIESRIQDNLRGYSMF